MRVIVVDNASGDETPGMVEHSFPEVDLVRSATNLGFSAAVNLGIRRGDAPYVLALNPDTRVLEGSLDRLLSVMEERPEVGISGGRLERDNGRLDHACRREFPTLLGAVGHLTGVGRGRRAPRVLGQYRAPGVERGRVDAISGACMMIRRGPLEALGLFDEGYWMHFEDMDLCSRFASAGLITWYEPSARLVHRKYGSTGRHRTLRVNLAFHFGMFRFWRLHCAPRRRRFTNVAVYAGIGGHLLASIAHSAIARSVSRPR